MPSVGGEVVLGLGQADRSVARAGVVKERASAGVHQMEAHADGRERGGACGDEASVRELDSLAWLSRGYGEMAHGGHEVGGERLRAVFIGEPEGLDEVGLCLCERACVECSKAGEVEQLREAEPKAGLTTASLRAIEVRENGTREVAG
jgi:hypothetical protein